MCRYSSRLIHISYGFTWRRTIFLPHINLMVINVTNWSYMNNCIPLLTRDTKEKKKHTESNGLWLIIDMNICRLYSFLPCTSCPLFMLICQRLLDGCSIWWIVVSGGVRRVCYLGEGVFWEVLVGEVTGLDQLAGDRGVWRVRGLPIGAWGSDKKTKHKLS